MDRQELRQVLTELLEETTGEPRDEVAEEQDLQEGLGLDSVDMFSLIVEIQSKLKIKIASEDLATVATVGDLLDVLQAKLAATAAPTRGLTRVRLGRSFKAKGFPLSRPTPNSRSRAERLHRAVPWRRSGSSRCRSRRSPRSARPPGRSAAGGSRRRC